MTFPFVKIRSGADCCARSNIEPLAAANNTPATVVFQRKCLMGFLAGLLRRTIVHVLRRAKREKRQKPISVSTAPPQERGFDGRNVHNGLRYPLDRGYGKKSHRG